LGRSSNEARSALVSLWCARLTWMLLPVSAGGALGDALAGWSTAPARVAAVFLWAAWTMGLIALLAPRPWGLTALRVAAPTTVLLTIASVASTSAGTSALAVSSSVVASVFALSASVAHAATNAMAYGDEVRFPLRVPMSLLLGPVPLAVALVGAGVAAGPLLIADGRIVAGVVVTALGFPVAFALIRSLHALSLRWLVLVPAGVVVVDPLTLADPVLIRREHIAGLGREPAGYAADDALDLRLGTQTGTIELTLHAPQPFARRRGRHDSQLRDAAAVLVSTTRPAALVTLAGERRIKTA
jgi:hypothetical protein